MVRVWALLLVALPAAICACQAEPAESQQTGVAISLPTGAVPGGQGPEIWFEPDGYRNVRNIAQASVLPVLPAIGKATGEAAVIFPGGGFMTLSYDWEGVKIAQVLANRGIAAFVVKYRLIPTPRDETAFKAFYDKRMSAWVGKPGERLNITVPTYAIEDGKAAMALVRSRAKEWKVDPNRVGVMGFSAGAVIALRVATGSTEQQRPAFAALLYPPMESIQVPSDAPPAFVAMALDDPLSGRAGFGLIKSWMLAGRPIEFHAYQKGEHGFSLGREGTTTLGWIDQYMSWLQMNEAH